MFLPLMMTNFLVRTPQSIFMGKDKSKKKYKAWKVEYVYKIEEVLRYCPGNPNGPNGPNGQNNSCSQM